MVKNKFKNIAFIFARGGSKGIKDKNIYSLNNKPLIAYTIEVAKESNIFDDIIVSTDSKRIALVAQSYGVKVDCLRPKNLAEDTSPEILSWKYEISRYQKKEPFDKFFCLPCTSPLRSKEDIINMSRFFDNNKFDLVLGITESSKSPLFNMVEKDQSGDLKIILKTDHVINRRQDSIQYYDIAPACYITTPDYVMNVESYFDGSIGGFEIPKERSIDIDTIFDMNIASYLIKDKKNHEK